ncbi:MAG: hypothetical protein J6Y86_07420 [Pseudobutyrivibrio sp.]|nr:hypothetical protein [Pseudobutyrivibrio sp.]
MAYNNAFPIGYQPVQMAYQQPTYPQPIGQNQMVQTPQQQQPSSMIWVQGETGAKSYLVSPNTTLPLWDSERQTIYLKSADATGMPSMKILDYTVRNDPNAQPHQVQIMDETKDYITREEFDKLRAEFSKFETDMRNNYKNQRRDNRNDKH